MTHYLVFSQCVHVLSIIVSILNVKFPLSYIFLYLSPVKQKGKEM